MDGFNMLLFFFFFFFQAEDGIRDRDVTGVQTCALPILSSADSPDVVLYFAHRAATHCDGSDAQAELTSLISNGLTDRKSVV